MNTSRGRLRRRVEAAFAATAALLALACMVSHQNDRRTLRTAAQREAAAWPDNASKIIGLTEWVHHNHGARENPRWFVLPRFRATPVQVLHSGGDCADKSRLLCALLREIDIPCTMILCFSRTTRKATHTVVEAQAGPGEFIVADPAYNLSFPAGGSGRYHDLLELRADPAIVDRRLAELIPQLPPTAPVYCYKPDQAAYDHASSINWNRNQLTRAAFKTLAPWYGSEIHRLHRPLVFEEPKLAVAALILAGTALLLVTARAAARCLSAFAELLTAAAPPKEAAACGP
jgi:hypothetical protein